MARGRLVALQAISVPASYLVPHGGTVTIGRRPQCDISCQNVAVSGVHCKLTCSDAAASVTSPRFELEDLSTNGTFVNEVRVGKGQRVELVDGDCISLTKPEGGQVSVADGSRLVSIQFRFEVQRPAQLEPGTSTYRAAVSVPPSTQCASTAEAFAQDLLVQEQKSTAKITSELLAIQSENDVKRSRAEALQQELRKAKATLEDDRTRRSSAEEARAQLEEQADKLRPDRTELQELRPQYSVRQEKHERGEIELGAQLQHNSSLEAARDRLKADVERERAGARSERELAEAQSKLQRAQERAELAQGKFNDAQQLIEEGEREVEKLQRELSSERSCREQLQGQLVLFNADLESLQRTRHAAQDQVEADLAAQADFEARIAKRRSKADADRASVQEIQHRQAVMTNRNESICVGANTFAGSLNAYARDYLSQMKEKHDITGGPSKQPGPGLVGKASAPATEGATASAPATAAACSQVSSQAAQAPHGASPCVSQPSQASRARPASQAFGDAQPLPSVAPRASIDGDIGQSEELESPASQSQPQRQPTPQQNSQPPAQKQKLLSLIVGSPDDSPLPAIMARAEEGVETKGLPMSPGCGDDITAVKRSATDSVLIMPGLQPRFKRPKVATT